MKVLYDKYDLGVQTRKAYKENDIDKLKFLVDNVYKRLIKEVKDFYSSFKKQWYNENKRYGFEIQDFRIGGLIYRLESIVAILKDYIAGTIHDIEELDEQVLSIMCDDNTLYKGVDFRSFNRIASANAF